MSWDSVCLSGFWEVDKVLTCCGNLTQQDCYQRSHPSITATVACCYDDSRQWARKWERERGTFTQTGLLSQQLVISLTSCIYASDSRAKSVFCNQKIPTDNIYSPFSVRCLSRDYYKSYTVSNIYRGMLYTYIQRSSHLCSLAWMLLCHLNNTVEVLCSLIMCWRCKSLSPSSLYHLNMAVSPCVIPSAIFIIHFLTRNIYVCYVA